MPNLLKGTTTAEEERITALLKGREVETLTITLMGRDSIDEVHHTNNSAGDFTEENDEVPGCQPTNCRIFQKESTHVGERILLEKKIEVSNKHSE